MKQMYNFDKAKTKSEESVDINDMIENLVCNAKNAMKHYMSLNQQKIDNITYNVAYDGFSNSLKLARMAYEETGRGIVEDKVVKNEFSTKYIWDSVRNEKTVGIVKEDVVKNYIEIADPIGIVAGVTPVTNPTSTTMFKSIICIKTRNPVIFGFHPFAQKCSVRAAQILRDTAIKFGAPEHCIQWITHPSIKATSTLMMHPDVSLVLATGGTAMVRSAYSTGKPAIGVGPGNVPCYIEKTANLESACMDIIISKTFDNGMICASEQSVIVDEEISKKFERIMIENGCYFLNTLEIKKLSDYIFDSVKESLNPKIVGKSAYWIASQIGLDLPKDTKILIAKLNGVGKYYPLSCEKLSPILSYYVVNDFYEGFEIAEKVLNFGGLGHTATIHSNNEDIIRDFGIQMKVGRIISNSPSSHGAIGGIYNTNIPSLTLGCGSYGKNSTTDNISASNLINRKRLYKRKSDTKMIKIPSDICFKKNSIKFLKNYVRSGSRVFIITNNEMIESGSIDKVYDHVGAKNERCITQIYCINDGVSSVADFKDGLDMIYKFNPDIVIAFGGNDVIDTAKIMWTLSELLDDECKNIEMTYFNLSQQMDKDLKSERKIKFIAIIAPIYGNHGLDMISTLRNDKNSEFYFLLNDHILIPDVLIVDAQFLQNITKEEIIDIGMLSLSCAIDSCVSTMSGNFTDGLSLEIIGIIRDYLPYINENEENHSEIIEKTCNILMLKEVIYTNIFPGLSYVMGMELVRKYNISYSKAIAAILPYVVEYNSSVPTKFAVSAGYKNFVANKKYSKISEYLGIKGENSSETISMFIDFLRKFTIKLGLKSSIKEYLLEEKTFLKKLDIMVENVYTCPFIDKNPRYPLMGEIREIYHKAYYGDKH